MSNNTIQLTLKATDNASGVVVGASDKIASIQHYKAGHILSRAATTTKKFKLVFKSQAAYTRR